MRRERSGNPQTKDGYAKIAHELLEAMARADLTKGEHSVLFVIVMKTYGWEKKADWISSSQLSKHTGIALEHCTRAVSGLVRKGLVTRRRDGWRSILSIQKRYRTWSCLRPELPSDKTRWRARKVLPELAGNSQPVKAGDSQPELAYTIATVTEATVTEDKDNAPEKSELFPDAYPTMVDPRIRSVIEDHLSPDCWHQTLVGIVNGMVEKHGVENVLLAEVEAVKSAVPAKGLLRYMERTLEQQAIQGYQWASRDNHSPPHSAAPSPPSDPMELWLSAQPMYRDITGTQSRSVQETKMRRLIAENAPDLEVDVATVIPADFVLAVYRHCGFDIPSVPTTTT